MPSSAPLRIPDYTDRRPLVLRPAPAKRGRVGRRSRRRLAGCVAAALLGWLAVASHPERIAGHGPLHAWLGRLLPASGLEIAKVEAHRGALDGQTVLFVEGALVNRSAHSIKAPGLVLKLIGADGQTLYTWTGKASGPDAAPGRDLPFRSRLLAPPETFARLEVSLADGG